MCSMKRIIVFLITAFTSVSTLLAQSADAKGILDKTASAIGRKGGAQANFVFSTPKAGSTTGTIYIKGNKFHARTPEAHIWFNGKTQWTYMKQTEEVNITTPTQAQQMSLNPYTFINIYKTGYTLSAKEQGVSYVVVMKAQNKQRTIQELVLTINRKTYVPTQIKMRQGSVWSTITVSNFQSKGLPNSMFVFQARNYPDAEIVDLRD